MSKSKINNLVPSIIYTVATEKLENQAAAEILREDPHPLIAEAAFSQNVVGKSGILPT